MEMWQVLAADKQLVTDIFTHMLETLSLGLPYQEKPKGNSGETVKMETPIPKAVSFPWYRIHTAQTTPAL